MKFVWTLILLVGVNANAADYPPWKNIHTVEAGQLYRSATLRPDTLEKVIREREIKTIINLRGERPGSEWYDNEVRVANELGVPLYSLGMSARRLPHREDLLELIDLYQNVERPILIHCQAGADRTGEAAAMWMIDEVGQSQKDALDMLRLKYLHVRWAYPAKSYFIENIYQDAQWAVMNYFPCDNDWEHYDREEFCN